jgi:hypothetical protein
LVLALDLRIDTGVANGLQRAQYWNKAEGQTKQFWGSAAVRSRSMPN